MSAASSDTDSDMKQRTLDLISKFEAKDIVEHDVVHSPKHVSVMLKFKKKEGIGDKVKVKDKDIGEGKDKKDDKEFLGIGKGKGLGDLLAKVESLETENRDLRKKLEDKVGDKVYIQLVMKIVGYMWATEKNHWREDDKPQDHIYHDLKTLNKLILGDEYETDSDSDDDDDSDDDKSKPEDDDSDNDKSKPEDDDDSDDDKTKPELIPEEQLNKMTKDKLHRLLAMHGQRANNKSKIRKGDLIELIVNGNFNWRPADDKSKTTDSD